MANINGWVRGTWGEGAWSSILPVNLTTAGAMTSAVGAVSLVCDNNVSAPSFAITSGVGALTVDAESNVTLPTFAVTSGLGAVTTDAEANVALPTFAVTSALGSVIIHENEVINLPSFLITSGFNGAGVSTAAAANAFPIGVSMLSAVGAPLVWGLINTDQNPNFDPIDTDQTPSYNDIVTY